MKEEKFLNVSIPADSEPHLNQYFKMRENILKYKWDNQYGSDLHGLKEFKGEHEKETKRLKEQQDKLNKSEFILTNRFLVYLTGENLKLEPFEIISFYEGSGIISLGIRLTHENIAPVMNMPKHDDIYQVNVELLSPTSETLYDIKYIDCKLFNFTMPQFEYKMSDIATVNIALQFSDKK